MMKTKQELTPPHLWEAIDDNGLVMARFAEEARAIEHIKASDRKPEPVVETIAEAESIDSAKFKEKLKGFEKNKK